MAINKGMQDFIHKSIPSSKMLGFKIQSVSPEEARVLAPLNLNINHMGTAFGGSIYSALVLSSYCWFYHLLRSENLDVRIVIQSAQIDYKRPVTKDFFAVCPAPSTNEIERFLEGLKIKGKSRLSLGARVEEKGKACAELKGVFVAFDKR